MKKALTIGALLAFSYLQADNFVFLEEQQNSSPSYNVYIDKGEPNSRVMLTPMGKEEMVMNSSSMNLSSTNSSYTSNSYKSMSKTSKRSQNVGGFWIQAGAFNKTKYAKERKALVGKIVGNVGIYRKDTYKRVVAGPFASKSQAMKSLSAIKQKYPDAFLTTKMMFN